MPVSLEVWGDYALFTRPEMKVERVSYDVMTPSAARGLIEAIYWHPGLRWVIDRIQVCAPIRFTNLRRNEVKSTISARTARTVMERALDNQPVGKRYARPAFSLHCRQKPLSHEQAERTSVRQGAWQRTGSGRGTGNDSF